MIQYQQNWDSPWGFLKLCVRKDERLARKNQDGEEESSVQVTNEMRTEEQKEKWSDRRRIDPCELAQLRKRNLSPPTPN